MFSSKYFYPESLSMESILKTVQEIESDIGDYKYAISVINENIDELTSTWKDSAMCRLYNIYIENYYDYEKELEGLFDSISEIYASVSKRIIFENEEIFKASRKLYHIQNTEIPEIQKKLEDINYSLRRIESAIDDSRRDCDAADERISNASKLNNKAIDMLNSRDDELKDISASDLEAIHPGCGAGLDYIER